MGAVRAVGKQYVPTLAVGPPLKLQVPKKIGAVIATSWIERFHGKSACPSLVAPHREASGIDSRHTPRPPDNQPGTSTIRPPQPILTSRTTPCTTCRPQRPLWKRYTRAPWESQRFENEVAGDVLTLIRADAARPESEFRNPAGILVGFWTDYRVLFPADRTRGGKQHECSGPDLPQAAEVGE